MSSASKVIEAKVKAGLQNAFRPHQLGHLRISFYAFPENSADMKPGGLVTARLYPDLLETEKRKKVSFLIKDAMDIVFSASALLVLSPVFLLLAIVIKLTSKGPVFFRQRRVGQYGVPFIFLKFRSMFVSTDAGIHKNTSRISSPEKLNPRPPGECENRLQNHERSACDSDRQVHAPNQPRRNAPVLECSHW